MERMQGRYCCLIARNGNGQMTPENRIGNPFSIPLAWCLLCTPLSLAGEPSANPSADERARAASLVKQLGHEDYQTREAAQAALRSLGMRAKVALEATLKEPVEEEVLLRATLLLRPLWMAEAQAAERAWLSEHLGPLFGARDFGPQAAKSLVKPAALGGKEPDPKPKPKPGEPEVAREKALEWLHLAQEEDGHWDSVKYGTQVNADLEQTSLALLAFLSTGHTERVGLYKGTVCRAVQWLKKQQRKDGAFLRPGEQEVDGLAHALAGFALSETACMGRTPETKVCAQNAVNYSLSTHQSVTKDGPSGFGRRAQSNTPDLFTTTFATMHLKSAKVAGLNVPSAGFDGVIRFLETLEDRERAAFRLSPDLKPTVRATFMGCLCRQFLGWKREDLETCVQKAVDQFKGPSTGEDASDLLGNYVGTLVLFQQAIDLERWRTWDGRQKSSLIAAERKEGAAQGSYDPSGEWSGAGRVFSTSISRLCFSIYYRWGFPLER